MSDNLYAPPQAELVTTAPANQQPPFYVVSRGKFLTLFICSLGLYQLYWAYKNWQQFKQATGEEMWPVARAFFAIFFTHALYREANARLKQEGRSHDWRPAELATLFVVITIISNLIDALSRKNIGSPLTDIISLALLPLQAWIAYLGQRGLNAAAGDPQGLSNARFTPLNYGVIVLGALVLVMALIGLTMPLE